MPTDNILLITMDDMRYDEMRYMPQTLKLIGGRNGIEFAWAFCDVPLCSPTRAGIYSGQLVRYHGIISNTTALGSTLYNNSTFKAIDNAGYRVGMIGKFFTDLIGSAVRPGFDFWRALQSVTAYGIYDADSYSVYDGTSTITPTQYQDHYLAGQGIDFIRGTEPWCLWYAPTSNHWPWQDPPNHTTEWAWKDFPFTQEASVADKPSWIQALPALTAQIITDTRIDQRHRLRELLAADDAIAAMVNTIVASGNADHTTILFHSDNGNMMGEHRITGGTLENTVTYKNMPYQASMHVPVLARIPGVPGPAKITAPVYAAQDIVKTMYARTGATALLSNQGGSSLANIAVNPSSFATRQLLGFRDGTGDALGIPSADVITDAQYRLTRYQGQSDPNKYELYDLIGDPDELTNQAYSGGTWLTLRNAMEASLNALLA